MPCVLIEHLSIRTNQWEIVYINRAPMIGSFAWGQTIRGDEIYIVGGTNGQTHVNNVWRINFEHFKATMIHADDGSLPNKMGKLVVRETKGETVPMLHYFGGIGTHI